MGGGDGGVVEGGGGGGGGGGAAGMSGVRRRVDGAGSEGRLECEKTKSRKCGKNKCCFRKKLIFEEHFIKKTAVGSAGRRSDKRPSARRRAASGAPSSPDSALF